MKVGPTVRHGCVPKKKGKDRTGEEGQDSQQKSRHYISSIWGEAPTEPICTEICTVVSVPDEKSRVQTFALKFSGVTVLVGVEFPIFLSILVWALQQCSANALPVID